MKGLKERIKELTKEQNELDTKRELMLWVDSVLDLMGTRIEPNLVYPSKFYKEHGTINFLPKNVGELRQLIAMFPPVKSWHTLVKGQWKSGAWWEGSEEPEGMPIKMAEMRLSCTCAKPKTEIDWFSEIGTMRLYISADLLDAISHTDFVGEIPTMRQVFNSKGQKEGRSIKVPEGWCFPISQTASDGEHGGAGYVYYAFHSESELEQLFNIMEGKGDGE